jgi:cbb3-type cytochrome oxidase subunit 1
MAAPEEFWKLHKTMLWSLVGAIVGVVVMALLLLPGLLRG